MSRSSLVFSPSRLTGVWAVLQVAVVVSLALLAACLCTAPAHATNLLVNPGTETGDITPWSLSSVMGAAVTGGISTGSTTVGASTLQATEGSRWFSGDGTQGNVGAVWSGYLSATQRVDVRGQNVDSVRFGGDGFAAGQILTGTSSALEVWHRHILIFLNADLGFLGVDDVSAQGGPQLWQSVADQAASSLGVLKTSAVPTNTAYIDFQQRYDLKAYSGSGMTYRVVAGLDNAFLEIATVPEPATYAMALAGLVCGGYSIWRRRMHRSVGRAFITAASLALAAAIVTPSSAHAVAVTVPAAAATTSGSSSWGFGFNGSQQVVQNLFPSNELAGLNPGDTILGLTIRDEGFSFPGRFNSPYTFPRFDIAIGPGTSSLTTAFTNNFTSPPTTVRTGSLTVGEGFFQGPLAFGSMISFDMPYTYGGGNLLIELRTISAQVGFSADLMEAAQTSGQLAYVFGNANATTASNISQYNFAMQLNVVPVPEPSTYAMALAGLACGRFLIWRQSKRF